MSSPLRAAAAALALLGAAAALWLAAHPAGACACGIAIEATVSEESGLVIERPGREQIVLSLDLSSDSSERAAVVLPVPGLPTVDAIEDGDPLAYLDLATATAPAPAVGSSAGGGEAAAAPPVEVIGRENVGGYDVARLGAGDALALDHWLSENGYTLPAGAEPILSDYIDAGWSFVAIRLAPEAEGRLKPLRVSFATDEAVYPMRLEQLATSPVNLTLYTLADGERKVDGLETVFAAPVDELDPAPPPQLADLLAEGTEVTRMEALDVDPASFTTDLLIDPVEPELEPAAAATVDAAVSDDGGVSTAGVLALIAAGLAFAVGLILITRPRGG
ncbi:MAG TPA: DUF2330 domain-containing protein [Solirubrobacterales bacterium]